MLSFYADIIWDYQKDNIQGLVRGNYLSQKILWNLLCFRERGVRGYLLLFTFRARSLRAASLFLGFLLQIARG